MAKKTVTPGQRLRRMREGLGLGARTMARRANLPEATIVGLETGAIEPTSEAFALYICGLTEVALRNAAERVHKLERLLRELQAKMRAAKAKPKPKARP